jgi:uncharacterized Zn finger protein
MAWHGGYSDFPDYVSVAERRARAKQAAARLGRKQGRTLAPIGPLEGSKIVRTFWGKAWCENLQSYSDYANRLSRGRSYVRHGAVVDLQIAAGRITALVSGSSLYQTTIAIQPLEPRRWKDLTARCTGQIDSLIDLLKGDLSPPIMEIVTHRQHGLFPAPPQIRLDCSCPDFADMCKHVAAVLFGVGVRFDESPALLFTLRGVDHLDLIDHAAARGAAKRVGGRSGAKRKVIKGADLSSLFGIEIEDAAPKPRPRAARR